MQKYKMFLIVQNYFDELHIPIGWVIEKGLTTSESLFYGGIDWI